MPQVRVRFAPSPTGVLHLGGARTALFNYLFAKHNNGKFLLRIEDTDYERSTKESVSSIMESLKWLGIDWEEEPIIQSFRSNDHKKALQKLIDDDKVYKCYCTVEERQAERNKAELEKRTYLYDGRCDGKPNDPYKPFVWRFRSPKEGATIFDDLVQGTIVTSNKEIEDFVVSRSDGTLLYNFVVVVDDAYMKITHVIRGKDHLTNTPKQILLYNALGLDVPKFGHLPLILGLSKRLRSCGIETYREQGYLPEAVNNYIARLGWSHKDQEIFTSKELIDLFTIEEVNKSEGTLNLDKMKWINQQHVQPKTAIELSELVEPFLIAKNIIYKDKQQLILACDSRRKAARTILELSEMISFYFVPTEMLCYDEEAVKKHLTSKKCFYLEEINKKLFCISNVDWTEESLYNEIEEYLKINNIQFKDIAQALRVALTGQQIGPSIYDIILVLGKEETISRLNNIKEIDVED